MIGLLTMTQYTLWDDVFQKRKEKKRKRKHFACSHQNDHPLSNALFLGFDGRYVKKKKNT